MVSKRQQLARKRFNEANPQLVPEPELKPSKNPKKLIRKKLKRKKSDSKEPNKSKRPSFTKHPLRVPGMIPGQSCYICKENDHIAKNCPEKSQWEKNKICLLCRKRGHSLKNCPRKDDETVDRKICYNCGRTDHSLSNCPKPLQDGGTKFASCFICNEQGHLSKNCPKNTHGIYPKGGSCKVCGGITHLAKDCPDKGIRGTCANLRTSFSNEERPKGKVTKFLSGDDLDDDFTTYNNNDESSPTKEKGLNTFEVKDQNVKLKKKQGPKIVNFVG